MTLADRLRAAFAADDFVEMNLQQESDTPELHQLLTVEEDRVVLIEDFRDRPSALAAGALSA